MKIIQIIIYTLFDNYFHYHFFYSFGNKFIINEIKIKLCFEIKKKK